ncbi:MAG: hypothetical protein C4542_02345 [Dehalococcoidia bacterium]|nr:MAG: hypothetical protein C4542_02345 [Dehalococcoidia bacterium]
MSENSTPDTGGVPSEQKPVVPWARWKTVMLIVVGLVAIGLTVNSSIRYEAAHQTSSIIPHPPPTYTGETPLNIASISEAYGSNNDFVMVITPCPDAALNTSITNLTVQAANKIRSTDRIYVGVFILPANNSLTYPTLTMKLFTQAASAFPVTLRSNITADTIYNQYLDRKFLR